MGAATQKDLLGDHEIAERLKCRPGWRRLSNLTLKKSFAFQDFRTAFAFIVKVAEAAEALNHHPEWCNVWNRVNVVLTTHSASGITELDFTLAQAIDRVAVHFSLFPTDEGEVRGCAAG